MHRNFILVECFRVFFLFVTQHTTHGSFLSACRSSSTNFASRSWKRATTPTLWPSFSPSTSTGKADSESTPPAAETARQGAPVAGLLNLFLLLTEQYLNQIA